MAGHLILMAVWRPGARAVSSMERKNSFGGTEGITSWGRGGPAGGGVTLGEGARAAGSPHSEGSRQHAGSVPYKLQDAGAHVLFDCRYPTTRRTFVISKP